MEHLRNLTDSELKNYALDIVYPKEERLSVKTVSKMINERYNGYVKTEPDIPDLPDEVFVSDSELRNVLAYVFEF